ncbi:unnamed protein product, partial [Citrullus colocynthis]
MVIGEGPSSSSSDQPTTLASTPSTPVLTTMELPNQRSTVISTTFAKLSTKLPLALSPAFPRNFTPNSYPTLPQPLVVLNQLLNVVLSNGLEEKMAEIVSLEMTAAIWEPLKCTYDSNTTAKIMALKTQLQHIRKDGLS